MARSKQAKLRRLDTLDLPAPVPVPAERWATVLPLWVGLAVALVLAILIVQLDRTNIGTTNGLWKSDPVSQWEHGVAKPLDSAGLLYLPVYGLLARAIPDDWVDYAGVSRAVTFRKMALWNAAFSGLAAGLVFAMSRRLVGTGWAAAVTMVHVTSAFILLNSLNSEDIMPGFAMVLAALYCLLRAVDGSAAWWVGVPLFTVLALGFHWTLMPPAVAAIGTVQLLWVAQGRLSWKVPVGSIALFLAALLGMGLSMNMPAVFILYPGKAQTGWAGFVPVKLLNGVSGVGNYFSGGYNGDFAQVTTYPGVVTLMTVTWIVTLAALAACLWALVRCGRAEIRALALFSVVLFAAGEAGAVYSQPQDPQMQVQPMFLVTAGCVVAGTLLRPRRWMAAGVAGLALVNGVNNVRLMAATSPPDSQAVRATEEMMAQFPHERTFYVASGFEGWLTWVSVMRFAGRGPEFQAEHAFLYSPFTGRNDIPPAEAVEQMRARIDAAFARGETVVAASLWPQTRDQFVNPLTTVTDEPRARAFAEQMSAVYRTGRLWHLKNGDFVELLPNSGAGATSNRP